jgi:hypothetical protein
MKGELEIMSKEQLAELKRANEVVGCVQDACEGLNYIDVSLSGKGAQIYENMCKGLFRLFSIMLDDAYLTLAGHVQEMGERE